MNGGPPEGFLMPILNYILLEQIMVHKIRMGYTSLKFEDFFEMCPEGSKGGREEWIKIKEAEYEFSTQKFSIRGAIFYNALPLKIRKEKSEFVFKKKAKEHILANKRYYEDLTRDYKISGECPSPKKRVVKIAINKLRQAGKLLKTGSPRKTTFSKRKGGLTAFIPVNAGKKRKNQLTNPRTGATKPRAPNRGNHG